MNNSHTEKKRRRRLLLESLERRELLAVDIWQIDLSGGGTIDLFGSQGGGQVQTQVQS
ncbi:MAG: hypothetical protein KDA59_03030, partial [Planctomycetales bacterium]|nr:hypothetical protein [Planctomycetales bacterium]